MKNFHCDFCKSKLYKKKDRFTKRLGIENTKFNVVQCKKCGLLSSFPFPTKEELQDIYSGYADKKNRISVEKERKENVYPLKFEKLKNLTKGNRLLDIGAGLGTFVYMAKNFGFDAFGVESERDQCEKAKELWGVELINDKIENVYNDFRDFDIVHLHHVLEHVYSPRKIFDIIYKILKPRGIILIEVPNQFFNIKKEIIFIMNLIKPPVYFLDHLYFFSAKSLKNYINKDKFRIIEFNQFRLKKKRMPIWEKIPKELYVLFIEKFIRGGGSFFELYLKKLS